MDSGSSTDILSAYVMMEDAMVEDLDQAQGRFQDSTPHSSADSETGFGSHAPVIGGAATRQTQASPVPPNATRHQQPQVQVSANLGRAYSEPASNFYASDNRYTSASLASGATADNWFSRSSAQQSQKLSGSNLEGQIVSDEIGLGSSGLHPHRLLSDMGSGAQAPQQWTPPASAHNAALAMLLSSSGGGRRHSTSSLPEQQPSPLSPLLASLSHEQQQLLVNAGLDPSLLMSVKAPVPAPTANPQLDTAEAVWQHVAASGADDQTLLALAAGLGLITTDANSGAVVLTREMNAQSPPLSARGSMFGGGAQQNGSSPQSAPLPRLSQPNLAGLLALQASFNNGTLRLPPGSPGLKNVCGSPGPSKQHTLYKTELCRGWLETGACRYGSKCQFAHGRDELRPVPRHPKYKTEVCRSFTATGVCAYGPRCRFIHGIASAPNALFDGAGRMVDSGGMEGVLGFDDLPAISPSNAAADAGGGPRKQLLSAVSGGSAALRQAAGGNSAAAAHDAASMAKIAARLLGNGGRGSLDSSMSMATVARASWSEVNRNSMDSRTGGNNNNGGRMSLESCMSQGDVMMAREMMLMGGASSSERLNGASSSERLSTGESNTICYSSPSHHQGLTTDALLSLSASLAAGGGGGMHQPFMPGIPEGCAMTLNSLPADPWAGIPTAGSQAAQQLRGAGGDGGAYNVPFNFLMPRNASQELPDTSGFMLNNLPAPQQGPAAGTWWDPATSAANNKQRAVAEQLVASSLHMSAYKSGLYAPVQSSTQQQQQQQQQAGGGKQQGFGPSPRASYPGVLTPEKSESSLEPNSDLNLRS